MQSHSMFVFRKTGDAQRLKREATVLKHVAHPDVVGFASLDGETLELDDIVGRTLADSPPQRPTEALAMFASLAAAVAHVHGRGVAHTRLDGTHVLIRLSGRPILCGFAEAQPMPLDDDTLATADVAALGRLMVASVPDALSALRTSRDNDPAEDAAALKLRSAGRRAINGEFTAAQLCSELRTISKPVMIRPPRNWRRLIPVGLAIVLTVCTVAFESRGGSPNTTAAAAPTTTTTSTTAYTGTLRFGSNDFSLAASTDQAVLARWSCGGTLPVLLRKNDGSVWVFDTWPESGGESRGRQVADVLGATSISVSPNGSCDDISVVTVDGKTRKLDLRNAR